MRRRLMSILGVSCSCFSSCEAFGDACWTEKLRAVPPFFFLNVMKKFFLSMVLALVCVAMSFAQNMMVATLTHGEEIKMYYGSYAYQQAMNDADHGDVINLSGGGFQATTITKAVSLRGAGIDSGNPTYIINDFNVKIPTTTSERLSAEGIYFSGKMNVSDTLMNAYFLKCHLKSFYCYSGSAKNAVFANCKVMSSSLNSNSTVQYINSYVASFNNYSSEPSFLNCTIVSRPDDIRSSTLLNSIIVNNSYQLPSTNIANNCVAVGNSFMFSNIVAGSNNKSAEKTIFIDEDPLNDLTDEAKAEYLGGDGTPVGMYGGTLPFNTTPSYPQITKMNVANKTTADGKLSVEIEVSAVE